MPATCVQRGQGLKEIGDLGPLPVLNGSTVDDERAKPRPQPHAIQRDALAAIERTRQEGFTAGLVVLATGLGKTWLAAFDSDRNDYRRVLFIAHREEILDQAITTFRQVRPTASIGRLIGAYRETDSDFVFASVQTLARLPHLSRFRADDFDYIVVDEFHHASAPTYRRIIDHFSPKFLLGLTATPDRTDGANLLTLCQENLVFQANVRDGIESGHLCPFHYFGVPDDVEYSNIPWRSTQFDIEELTAAVATEARALNALDQLRKRGGRRCIAFCCSQRHADFMARIFVREGLRAVAVHSGPSSAPRATSLQKLGDGALDAIFAVDMFNEGVDVPSIDTVLMLRPTESSIIWLQQLGRGLRVSREKKHLTVIDYIGNHRAFLNKLQGMATILDHSAESGGRQRELLQAIRDERIDLPAGCDVTYETTALNILEHLARPTRIEGELESFYRGFEERNGVRPTAVETHHAGLNPRSNSERSWLGFVERMGGLSTNEQAAWATSQEFFDALERIELAGSHELVLLLAMFDGETLGTSLSTEIISRRATLLVRRIHGLATDFSARYGLKDIQSLLFGKPINSLVGMRGSNGGPYFKLDGDEFGLAFPIFDSAAFGTLLREILDWRLAQYLARGPVPDVICRVSRDGNDSPILILPTNAGRPLEGFMEVELDARPMQAFVTTSTIDVVTAGDSSDNELPLILRAWFGNDTGLVSRSDQVRFRREGRRLLMEPLAASLYSGARPWERYLREDIPPAYGLPFNPAIWNVGFVVNEFNVFLLVTLAKDDMNADHRYSDHFLSDQEFNWQSQNRTTQESKHGQIIRDHVLKDVRVHLFVRPTKKTGSRSTPFTYCGEVDFVSWEGNKPITVRWRLRERVPPSLHASLKVPA
jgi:superfamily II DNA or RNA helicase